MVNRWIHTRVSNKYVPFSILAKKKQPASADHMIRGHAK